MLLGQALAWQKTSCQSANAVRPWFGGPLHITSRCCGWLENRADRGGGAGHNNAGCNRTQQDEHLLQMNHDTVAYVSCPLVLSP